MSPTILGRLLRLLTILAFLAGSPAAVADVIAGPVGANTGPVEEEDGPPGEAEETKAAPVENRDPSARPTVRRSSHVRTPNSPVPSQVVSPPNAAAALANGLGTHYRI